MSATTPPFPSAPPRAPHWRRFIGTFAAVAAVLMLALYGMVAWLDPYGLMPAARSHPGPIMDLNQRFMYPQIVRSRRYDAAVFGTSTVRLLDPQRLDSLFGARFANLAMNAATPWEQMQLADLFLRETPAPNMVIFGLDTTWCEADADAKRLTFRAFPPWLYDENHWNDWPELLNLKSLEIATRVAAYRLGLMPERIRGDGYEVFVPPDGTYDLARAKAHIWGDRPRTVTPVVPAVTPDAAERAAWRFPALPWLDERLARLPRETRKILVFPPVHVAAQPPAGSLAAAREAECKRRVSEIGRSHGAAVVDFSFPSPVTGDDANYWDPLHYRIGIAERFVTALHDAEALPTGSEGPFYRVLASRPRGTP